MQRTLITVALIVFGTLTAIALWQHGYWGIILRNFENTASMQVFVDLVIALLLITVWMWRDASANGRNIWPWIALTLIAGSFGPLGYLMTQRKPNA